MKRLLALVTIVGLLGSLTTAFVSANTPSPGSGRDGERHLTTVSEDLAIHGPIGRPAASIPDTRDLIVLAASHSRQPQYVFPPDERVRVSPANPLVSQIWSIFDNGNGVFDENDSIGLCTATLIGPKVLLTAAHCLYIHEMHGWPTWVAVVPGLDGDDAPFGIFWSEYTYVSQLWIDEPHPVYDVGLIIMPDDTPIGEAIGYLPLGALTDASLAAPDIWATTLGYPVDKPFGTQWLHAVPALEVVQDTLFSSRLDQYQGQSGSAILRAEDLAIFGIVSVEITTQGTTLNVSRRITQDVIDFALAVCADAGCSFDYFVENATPAPTPPPPQPTPTATATPPPQPTETPPPSPTATPPPAEGDPAAFHQTWERTDRVVSDGSVSRTWMWGPEPFTGVMKEPYVEGSNGSRSVQYYDKSRMEITDSAGDPNSPWYVTNGLLVTELVSGRLQLGDNTFEQHQPAQVNAAGDPDDATGPTYATFGTLLNAAPNALDAGIIQRVDRNGTVTSDPALASQGVTAAHHVPETNHTVASVFWEFMNSDGAVYENGVLTTNKLFENPFYATGFPITEPYWASVKVGGVYKDVLIQVFQRRVLTFTPGNPEGFQVEAGNVGRHYFHWRYELIPNELQ